MTMMEICEEIIDVEEGLMMGTVSFTYDNLMSAIKPGHPMEILDGILAQIYFDVIADRTPDLETVKTVLAQLKEFKACFKVNQLAKPIRELAAYIQSLEKAE